MNPFDSNSEPKFVTLTDQPDARVMLECQKCGIIVTEGKYNAKAKLLTWKCECGFVSHQKDFEL